MNLHYLKTGINELIPCYIVESRDDGTKRIRLLSDSTIGQYKKGDTFHTMPENVINEQEFRVKVINIEHTSYIMTGEIYDVIGVKYVPVTFQNHDSILYKIRILDGRIGLYLAEHFEIV